MQKRFYNFLKAEEGLSQSHQEKKKNFQKTKILKHLLLHGESSCAELAKSINLSYPCTSELTKQLLEEGIIQNESPDKPNNNFKLNEENCLLILTISIYPKHAGAILYDQIQNSIEEINLDDIHFDINELTKSLKNIFLDFAEKSKSDFFDILGVSFLLPSSSLFTGRFPSSEELHRCEKDLEGFFGKSFSISNPFYALQKGTFILNRKSLSNSLIINIDNEIGLSIISEGQMKNNRHSPASSFGHIPLGNNGSLCTCGKRDCLETLVSNKAVINKMYSKLSERPKTDIEDVSIETVIKSALSGDQIAIDIIFGVGYTLGKAMSILIQLIAPEKIIIISDFSRVQGVLSNGTSSGLNLYCPLFKSQSTVIEFQEPQLQNLNRGLSTLHGIKYSRIKSIY